MAGSFDTNPDRLAAVDRASQLLSPSALYFKLDDEIRVTAYNAAAGVTLEVRSRILGVGGDVQVSRDPLIPTTARAASAAIVSTDEGWLLGGEVMVAAGTPLIGQCFVVVEVVRGLASSAQPYQTIAAGYVTAKQPLPFPSLPVASSLDGGGALRAIVGTLPAAGAEILETVPTGARWELIAFGTLLTTAVAAANRIPTLVLDDGANVIYAWSMNGNETASLPWQNYWAQGTPALFITGQSFANGPLPVNNRLPAGARIRTVTAAIQAADQWSTPKYLVREWIEGQ